MARRGDGGPARRSGHRHDAGALDDVAAAEWVGSRTSSSTTPPGHRAPPTRTADGEDLVAEVLAAAARPLRIASDQYPLGRLVAGLALVAALVVAVGGFLVLRAVIDARPDGSLTTSFEDHRDASRTGCDLAVEAPAGSGACARRAD
jgi:hypothetical protein